MGGKQAKRKTKKRTCVLLLTSVLSFNISCSVRPSATGCAAVSASNLFRASALPLSAASVYHLRAASRSFVWFGVPIPTYKNVRKELEERNGSGRRTHLAVVPHRKFTLPLAAHGRLLRKHARQSFVLAHRGIVSK